MRKKKRIRNKHRLYENYSYEEIFNKLVETKEDAIEGLRKAGRYKYMIKTIKSGPVMEVELYPLWETKNDVPRIKKGKSREAQINLNNKNARKTITRLLNTNFTKDDLMISLTYDSEHLPTEDEARRDIQNYIKRIKRYRKRNGLPELKYLYVIEFSNKPSKKIRVHHHIVMNCMDRDKAEELWGKGFANTRRLEPNDFGLEGVARYIAKDLQGSRRWSRSRNLKQPKITKCSTRLTLRKVEKMIRNEIYKEVFEKMYKDYIYKDSRTMYSDISAGFYIYARFKRRE